LDLFKEIQGQKPATCLKGKKNQQSQTKSLRLTGP